MYVSEPRHSDSSKCYGGSRSASPKEPWPSQPNIYGVTKHLSRRGSHVSLWNHAESARNAWLVADPRQRWQVSEHKASNHGNIDPLCGAAAIGMHPVRWRCQNERVTASDPPARQPRTRPGYETGGPTVACNVDTCTMYWVVDSRGQYEIVRRHRYRVRRDAVKTVLRRTRPPPFGDQELASLPPQDPWCSCLFLCLSGLVVSFRLRWPWPLGECG